MEGMAASDTKALYIVVNAGFSGEVMDVAREAGAKGATIINARGEGIMHKSFLGITVDSEKEIILILIDEETSVKIMNAVKDSLGVHTPAQSICFTVPVSKTTALNNFVSG